jgi:2-oxoglutarate ferredoxin oxidoreductase subunit beta
MNTYGFHTIHGRAPAIATGVKLANPELDVWVITGDGDGLSIGGNHLMHVLRRNVNLQVLLFNNEIYGLTKGQYSPTSKLGLSTPSTPEGAVDNPVSPSAIALGVGGRFVARGVDTQIPQLCEVVARAHANPGASFVEIFQNCNVYNDGAFDEFTERSAIAERQIHVRHGEPLRFGANGEKGLRLDPRTLALEVIRPGEDGSTDEDVLVHDETSKGIAQLLVEMRGPQMPVAIGVLYCAPAREYVSEVYAQRETVRSGRGVADMNALLRQGHTWTV